MTPIHTTFAPGVAVLHRAAILLPLLALPFGPLHPAEAAKPHPLFGRSVVGNSAELFLFSPTSGASGDYFVRMMDYDSVTASMLEPGDAIPMLGGRPAGQERYSTLDVVMGDFDGDDRDEPIVARGLATGSTWNSLVFLAFGEPEQSLDWTPSHQVDCSTMGVPPNAYRSTAGLRLVAGDLDSDGRDELIRVMRCPGGVIRARVMAMDETGHLSEIADAAVETQPDWLLQSARFDAACGDFDGDGDQELVVAGVRPRGGSTSHVELFVHVLDFAGGALALAASSAWKDVAIGRDGGGSGQHIDHIAIATGAMRPQLKDQVAFAWAVRNAYWYENDCMWCCAPFTDYAYDFDRIIRAEVMVLDVNTGGSPWQVSGWGTGAQSVQVVHKLYNDACSRPDLGHTDTGPSLGLAVGDLTGDGIAEVVMAGVDKLNVYRLGAPGLGLAASTPRQLTFNDPSRRVVAIVDLDADVTKPSRWVPELVSLDWASNTTPRVTVYRPVVNASGTLTSLNTLCSMIEGSVTKWDAEVALAVGDMDGDAVRLGEPTYHPAISVTQPRVLLKTPPVHFDVLDGTVYDLAQCYDGSGDYLCECFQASYSKSANTTFAVKTETKTDWGVSAGLKTDHEFLGVSLETSMKAEYGENFSRSGETVTSYTVEQQVMTAGQDRILADEIRYDVWEYPVYARGAQGPRTLMGHFSVVRPLSVSQPRWFTHSTWPTSYNPLRHEAGNVLSYPRFGSPEQDPNVAEMWKSDRWDMSPNRVTDVYTEVCGFNFGLSWSDVVSQGVSESWKAGVEMGASVGAYGCTVELSGHYSHEEVATRQTTVGDGIQMGVSLGSAGSVAEAPCTIQPYVYRGKDGSLVLDYTVEPVWGSPGSPNWWDTHYTTSPDAAFVLPRRYHALKGIPVQDPRTIWRTPDIWVRPDTAAVGDTVTVYATVHNFSLDALPGPVKVRLTMGDPREPGYTLIESLEGDRELAIPGGVFARDTATVRMRWRIPSGAPATSWIYAQVDPGGDVAEIHEDNNVGYAVMKVAGGTSVDVEPESPLPAAFRLLPAAPNPFRDLTAISFDLPAPARATLHIYDIAGREVAVLADGPFTAGRHVILWSGRGDDGRGVPAGVYFARLRSGAMTGIRRLMRLR